ncbi:MAG: CoA transferase, partial [Chloroflexota bacterium]|nr:CoA transferase [Chloroflexota bacterium]
MQKPTQGMPLKNYRVLDLSRIWAGPYCTKLFADMGAEIIKMESLSVYDSHRGPVSPAPGIAAYPDAEPGEEPWNRNGWFNCLHMSKYGVTLELTKPEGKQVFERLVSISDVVIENFRQGSLERLGYTYEELRKHRPDLIYVSMPAFGNTGPWKGYLGYGIGQEQLSGMAHMTGYRGEGPMKSGINHGDPITGSHAAGVLMAALRHRRKTGKGMFIDVSQQESSVALMGPEVLAYQMTGREPERLGNRSSWYAPANSYPCAGEDRWVTIAVTNNDQWAGLARTMGAPGMAEDPRFATADKRQENQDELDAVISEWTVGQEASEITNQLQNAGVPSGPVLRGPDLLEDRHYT